jgi:tetratricopeptide (TPR) repeat protein
VTDGNDLIETLFGLGNALNLLGQPAEAEAAILESLAMAERVYGLQHSRLAGPLSALGNLQRALGRYGPAADSLRRAIAIMERDYRPNDPGVLGARNNLALALGAAGDRAGEQAELRRLIAIKQSGPGPEDLGVADNYQNLGTSLGRSGDHAQALQALDVAQRMYDRRLPESSPMRAFPRLTRARVLLDQQHPAAAEVAAREASAILVRTLPAGHYAIGIADCLRAEARAAQGDAAGAARLITRAWPLLAKAPATQATQIARCRALRTSTSPPG